MTQNVSFGNFNRHFTLTKGLTLEISMVILDQLRILPMEISIVICINQSFNVGNFRRHFRLTELKCWPWKFLWLFVLPLANFGLGNFHGHFGLTPKFWRWKFPSPICVALEYDAQQIHAYFFYIKSIHLLQFGNIFDISLYSWHEFFFLAIIVVNPEFLANHLYKKNMFVSKTWYLSLHPQRTGNFGRAS